jgi:hypothetical protein
LVDKYPVLGGLENLILAISRRKVAKKWRFGKGEVLIGHGFIQAVP